MSRVLASIKRTFSLHHLTETDITKGGGEWGRGNGGDGWYVKVYPKTILWLDKMVYIRIVKKISLKHFPLNLKAEDKGSATLAHLL